MENPLMPRELFLDTAYAIALSASNDQYHQQAVQIAHELTHSQTRLITTRAVLLEIGNALSKYRYRSAGSRLLTALENDPLIGIVPLTESLYHQALVLYQSHTDKEWGLVDCLSFVVMRERQLDTALTTDQHFEQAGYRILLK